MSDATLATFAASLAMSLPDRTLVADRRERVFELLQKAGTGAWLMFESGSFSHGTAIPVHSDVDYMARTDLDNKPSLPSTALRRVKAALADASDIRSARISSPAVKVQFWTPPDFEVAPAFYERKSGDDEVFHIAGPNEEWVLSAPTAHNRYVSTQNDRLGKKAKPLIRLLKAWKYHTGTPISSTYLELRTAQYLAVESSVIYDIDLRVMFSKMLAGGLAAMNDPLGIVTRIRPCSSEASRLASLAAMRRALNALQEADLAKASADTTAYWVKMSGVFGSAYPWPSW